MLRAFTVPEYHELIRLGFFATNERYELLDGLIVANLPRGPAHDCCLGLTERVIARRLPGGWHTRVRSGLTTAESEPEPDITVVRGGPDDYIDRHPGAADVALVVEVAAASLAHDTGWKRSVYARASVAAYWVVDIAGRRVERYGDPDVDGRGTYADHETYVAGTSVPLDLPEPGPQAVAVDEILPPLI